MASVEEQKRELESTRVIEEGDCICGGRWTRGETRSGWLAVSHTTPGCDLYLKHEAPDYLRALATQQERLD